MNQTQISAAIMRGGLNITVPPLGLDPGEAIQLHNYELTQIANYRRLKGFARVDGRTAFLQEKYRYLSLELENVSQFTVGDTVYPTGQSGTVEGTVVSVNTALNAMAVAAITDAMAVDAQPFNWKSANTVEKSGGTPVAIIAAQWTGGPGTEAIETFVRATDTFYRTQTHPVPGVGPVRGVFIFQGTVYAFRDLDEIACAMYRAVDSAAGWERVATPNRSAGGTYKILTGNFSGSAATIKVYGVDGKNRAWEFDGTTFTEISTFPHIMDGEGNLIPDASQAATYHDNPNSIAILPKPSLVLGFARGSLLLSEIGDPTDFFGFTAQEIAVSQPIVDLALQPDNRLAIFTDRSLQILFTQGVTSENYELTTFSDSLGIKPGSLQDMGDSIFVTDAGIRRLQRADVFGDFQDVDLSGKIERIMADKAGSIVASMVLPERNQYRVFFSDRSGVAMTFSGADVLGVSTFSFDRDVACTFSSTRADEPALFGDGEGYVQRMDYTDSFDGDSIRAYFRTAFLHMDEPERRKRFKKLVAELQADRQVSLRVIPQFDYSGPESLRHWTLMRDVAGSGGYYDVDNWNEIFWSSGPAFAAEFYLSGVYRNCGFLFLTDSDVEPPHTISTTLVHYANRGRKR